MKDRMIMNLTPVHIEAIAKNFNKDKLERWKVGMQDGVKRNDWIDLLGHCMYILDYFHNAITFNCNYSRTENSRDA